MFFFFSQGYAAPAPVDGRYGGAPTGPPTASYNSQDPYGYGKPSGAGETILRALYIKYPFHCPAVYLFVIFITRVVKRQRFLVYEKGSAMGFVFGACF